MTDRPTDPLEARVAKLEGLFEQLNERLGALESDVRALRGELTQLRSDMDAKFEAARKSSRSQFFWLLGVLITGLLLPSVIGLLN